MCTDQMARSSVGGLRYNGLCELLGLPAYTMLSAHFDLIGL